MSVYNSIKKELCRY